MCFRIAALIACFTQCLDRLNSLYLLHKDGSTTHGTPTLCLGSFNNFHKTVRRMRGDDCTWDKRPALRRPQRYTRNCDTSI